MSKRLHIVFILVLLFSTLVFTQDKQVNEDKQLREEILSVYKSGGEQGLLDFVKENNDKITNKFIVDFAKAGVKERKEKWLKVCEIIAKESKDEKTFADVQYQIGIFFILISDNKKAAHYIDMALPYYHKLNDLVGQGNVYLKKGVIHYYIGENSKALDMYAKALEFFERATAPLGQGNVYLRKGDIYSRIGENSKMLEMYDKALPLFEKAGSDIGLGHIYRSKGDVYSRTGEISKAQDMYDKALPLFEKVGSDIGLGHVYKSKGDIYFLAGDILKALMMYDKVLPIFEKAKDPRGQGNVYKNKGVIYFRTGETSKAQKMYDKALHFFEKAEDLIGMGSVYRRKGDIYLRTGGNSKALKMYNKALPLFEKSGDSIGRGNVYFRKGNICFSTGDNSSAIQMYDKALLFFKKLRDPISQGTVYLRKGDIYLEIDEMARALEMYEEALSLFEKAAAIESESDALYGKAKVLVKLGKKDNARELFEKAIAKLEKVRDQTVSLDMKRTFMEKVYEQYEDTVLFMLENKYYDKSFKYAESMRARVFLDRMAEGFVKLDKGLTPELEEERDDLTAKLSILSKDIHKTAGKNDGKTLRELKEQYQKTGNQFEELLVKIRLNNPLYASVRYPEPISIRTLQKEILKKGELLLRYFSSPDKLYVFLVSKDDFRVVPLDVKEMDINGDVNRCLSALKESNSRDMRRYGKKLYQTLFKPLKIKLKDNSDVIIIPDGELARIPFECFILDDSFYLVEKYRVKYVQSASVLSVLRKQHTWKRPAKSFIGFGDPVYNYENFNQGKPQQGTITRPLNEKDEIRDISRNRYARAGGIMNRLQASGQEMNAIAGLFEKASRKSVVHLREQATEENAKAPEIKDFDFIHFACHGLLNDDFQSLVLSQLPSDKSKEDGYFTLNEIMNCHYNAKLVVLSACQTGSGKMYKGEGVTGLTRAVMYAGTPAVVASLWDVDDRATKELMVRFYRNMLENNMDKTEALRQAKLELIKTKKYHSPLFWSAFIMYGE
jgi:CHAT domain-containing protein/predicted negative regulator of RcsB-dependent stress response